MCGHVLVIFKYSIGNVERERDKTGQFRGRMERTMTTRTGVDQGDLADLQSDGELEGDSREAMGSEKTVTLRSHTLSFELNF